MVSQLSSAFLMTSQSACLAKNSKATLFCSSTRCVTQCQPVEKSRCAWVCSKESSHRRSRLDDYCGQHRESAGFNPPNAAMLDSKKRVIRSVSPVPEARQTLRHATGKVVIILYRQVAVKAAVGWARGLVVCVGQFRNLRDCFAGK